MMGGKYHPKHVEQFPDINKLCNVCILLDVYLYWNIRTMHGTIKFNSPNNKSKWQMGFNSAFKRFKFVAIKFLDFVMSVSDRCICSG
jgi:hypothetical protein